MPRISYLLKDGTLRTVDAAVGASVMETAIKNNLPGIDAECGGCLSCATCHVYVDEAWADRFAAPEDDEAEMLGFVAAERRATSRLGCQLVLGVEHEGLVVRVPAMQVAE